jgi:hypothetical protein
MSKTVYKFSSFFNVCGSVHLGNIFYSNPTGCTIFFFIEKFLSQHCRRTAAAIQERVTAVLRSIPKETFAEFPEAL